MNLEQLLINEPKFRREQIYRAWFDAQINSFDEITTLPKNFREKLSELPWMPVEIFALQESRLDETKKALLRLTDGELTETVLMGRISKKADREEGDSRFTICVSSQIGCPMQCTFCATGKLGFIRNLSAEEIIGQFRFWRKYLSEHGGGEIGNVVFMGQGEPFLNFEAVRDATNILVKYAGIGVTKITISTGGVISGMNKMIEDKDFPAVRFALSLHSAIPDDRKKLMPSQPPKFFEFMIDWAKKYHERFPSRTHFFGLEYLFIEGVNDSDKHLKELIKLASKLGRVRLNLIPFNQALGEWHSTPIEKIKEWQKKLMAAGFTVTVRLSQGSDIAAACGQLRNIYDDHAKK